MGLLIAADARDQGAVEAGVVESVLAELVERLSVEGVLKAIGGRWSVKGFNRGKKGG